MVGGKVPATVEHRLVKDFFKQSLNYLLSVPPS